VADLRGPGVVILIRDRETNWYLRTVVPDDIGIVR
jgi:hypothetical protein